MTRQPSFYIALYEEDDPVQCGISGSPERESSPNDITLDAQLCFAIYKSSHKVGRLYRHYLQGFGLTLPLYLVMIVLWERSPCNVGDIVQALDLETNTVTPLLKRLQTLGYVSRERDRLDERKVTIALTGQGQALRDEAVAIRTDFIERSGISYPTIVEMRRTLHHLSEVIDGLMRPAPTS